LGVILVALACGPKTAPPTAAPSEPAPIEVTSTPSETPTQDASALLSQVEQRMIAEDFHVAFSVRSSGVVESSLVGEVWAQGDRMRITANGTFGGRPMQVHLTADGERVRGGAGDTTTIDVDQPPELKQAVVVGLTRMGVLHNVARLLGGRPPDHAEGGVDPWLQALAVESGPRVEPTELSEEATDQPVVSFDLHVAGERTGEVSLWVDPAASWPVERHQVVTFPEGEMRVREVYRRP
jgi:hypothetical protein